MVGTEAATRLLLLLHFCLCQQVKDDSRVISVARIDNNFEVLPGEKKNTAKLFLYDIIIGLKYLDSVVVWANLTDDQESNGWYYIEITSNPNFPDEIQAKAAGFAEGYLTRNFIYHYYQGVFCCNIYYQTSSVRK